MSVFGVFTRNQPVLSTHPLPVDKSVVSLDRPSFPAPLPQHPPHIFLPKIGSAPPHRVDSPYIFSTTHLLSTTKTSLLKTIISAGILSRPSISHPNWPSAYHSTQDCRSAPRIDMKIVRQPESIAVLSFRFFQRNSRCIVLFFSGFFFGRLFWALGRSVAVVLVQSVRIHLPSE